MVNDDELFLGRYSSSNFSGFYLEYKEFINRLNAAPANVRKQFMHDDNTYDYNKLAVLFNSYKDKNSQILFRKSDKAKDFIIDLWLCKVRNKVRVLEMLSLPPYKKVDEALVSEILKISSEKNGHIKISAALIELGIVVVFEESFPGLNLDGAVYTNAQGHPIIALSLRHNRIDNFWFTLAHELAHIILHYDNLNEVIIDDVDESIAHTQGKEFEANKLAGDLLIPRRIWRSCPVKHSNSTFEVEQFADEVNIHPAIIAGRIRRERANYKIFTDIIYKEDLRKDLFL
ncbi:ImmA/IrrE family metallo-endopeptidase [Escherichia coli]|nr:ImmA/IrrE family metallo-endopeptidase [Escherichia coli]EES0430117.1 ImmA/IrrE family metallo-endopeptidase [Escherichia coli]EET1490873.1 ImmA/IrrE family metallo-endopeptidase [Escherichia coli]EEV1631697.1 ImmA/IrrE family metallo-endopeptidase [Escherichia coli]EEV2399840.1 ImmA/IrrE family metallo-endopeptidase [Escherichia coli]